jgi:hypothetical protein
VTVPWLLLALVIGACGGTPVPTTPAPSPTPRPTPTAAGASATPSASLVRGQVTASCLQGIEQPEGAYTSYIAASVTWQGLQPSQMLLLIDGANEDQAAALTFDPASSAWQGHLGMHEMGAKRIDRLFVVYPDGSGDDVTISLLQVFGGPFLEFQRSGDAFGVCDV